MIVSVTLSPGPTRKWRGWTSTVAPLSAVPLAVYSRVSPLTLRAVRVVVRTPGISGASIDGVFRSTRWSASVAAAA